MKTLAVRTAVIAVFSAVVFSGSFVWAQASVAVDKATIEALTKAVATLTTTVAAQGKTTATPVAATTKAPAPAVAKAATLEAQVRELQVRLGLLEQIERKRDGGTTAFAIGAFAPGSAVLTESLKDQIRLVLGQVRRDKPEYLGVIGYTSTTGDTAKNKKLAKDRADAVKAFVDATLAAPLALVAGAATPAAIPPVVTPDNVGVDTGGDEGQTADFSLRLGALALNQVVVIQWQKVK